MKQVQLFTKRKSGMIGMVCLVATLFTSCLKNNDDDTVPTQQPAALLSVINASTSSQSVDFYLEQTRLNSSSIPYGVPNDYFYAKTGKRTAAFYASGTQQLIKSDTMTLQQDKFYSLALINTPTQADFLLLRDSIAKPAADKATIRLVNVSSNAGSVDLAIKDGALLATNKGFKGSSPFIAVQGNSSYTLEIRQTGTSTVLASLTNVQLNSNSVYTIWLQGLTGATDQTKLTAKLQKNVYY
jgi:hypothetical protein